jgi:hypothetical protein
VQRGSQEQRESGRAGQPLHSLHESLPESIARNL